MADVCRGCLEVSEGADWHPACLRALYGLDREPELDVDRARLHTLGLAMVGRTALSGVQRKISLGLTADRMTLRVAVEGAQYILKPASETFPALPENEHLTMRIAEVAGVRAPPRGLVRLADGSWAYIVRRFDRDEDGKLRQEDFCQLAGKATKEKYQGSAELCARLVKAYASEPGIAGRDLFRLMLVSWWTGNGDMHLKNFSLLCGRDGRHALAPAYDLLCTRLVIPGDRLALPVGGRDGGLTRRGWLEYAAYCGVPRRAAERVTKQVAAALAPASELVERSFLPDEMKAAYRDLLRERAGALTA